MQQQQNGNGSVRPHRSDMAVGEILRRERIRYDQTVFDIENSLRIKASLIEAIESGQFDKLPGRVYTVGFIRTYSEYLGLDGEKMVSLYKSQSGTKVSKPEYALTESAQEKGFSSGWLVAASLVMAIGTLVLWSSMKTQDRANVNEIPSVPPTIAAEGKITAGEIQIANVEKAGPVAPVRTVQATEPAAGSDRQNGIILKIVQNSWVEIKDKEGKEVVSRVLKAGDKYFVPSRPDLFMSLGNSGGVRIEIGGEDLPNLGSPGQVLRNVPLDIEILKKKFSR